MAILYTLIGLLVLSLIINAISQRIKLLHDLGNLSQETKDLKSQIVSLKNKLNVAERTATNSKNLYEDIKKENADFARAQINLNGIISTKNITFQKFVYELTKIDETNADVIQSLFDLSIDPNLDQEMLGVGHQVVADRHRARKEIEAIVSSKKEES